MLKLKVNQSASADLVETAKYYSQVTPDLAEAFLKQVEAAFNLLLEHPNIGSRRFAHLFSGMDLRTWSLDRFPFRIFYTVDGNMLNVLRIDHESRKVSSETLKPD